MTDIDTLIRDADRNLATAKQGMVRGRTESDRKSHRNNNDAYSYILDELRKLKERKKDE